MMRNKQVALLLASIAAIAALPAKAARVIDIQGTAQVDRIVLAPGALPILETGLNAVFRLTYDPMLSTPWAAMDPRPSNLGDVQVSTSNAVIGVETVLPGALNPYNIDFAIDTGFFIDASLPGTYILPGTGDIFFFAGEAYLNSGYTLVGTITSAFASVYDDDRYSVMNITIAVPEMATWAMMIAGFALLGGVLRQRAAPQVRFA